MISGTLESESHGGLVKTEIAVGPSSQVTLVFPVQGHALRTTATEVEPLNESLQDPYFVQSFLVCVSNLCSWVQMLLGIDSLLSCQCIRQFVDVILKFQFTQHWGQKKENVVKPVACPKERLWNKDIAGIWELESPLDWDPLCPTLRQALVPKAADLMWTTMEYGDSLQNLWDQLSQSLGAVGSKTVWDAILFFFYFSMHLFYSIYIVQLLHSLQKVQKPDHFPVLVQS